jgi:hypothetical protein
MLSASPAALILVEFARQGATKNRSYDQQCGAGRECCDRDDCHINSVCKLCRHNLPQPLSPLADIAVLGVDACEEFFLFN